MSCSTCRERAPRPSRIVGSISLARHQPSGDARRIGRDAPSTVYLDQILAAAPGPGTTPSSLGLQGEATEASVAATIRAVNADPAVDGVIVQMPLPPHPAALPSMTPSTRPIDGIHPLNAGLCAWATTASCRRRALGGRILRRSGIEIAGADAVVIGRSNVVACPAASSS